MERLDSQLLLGHVLGRDRAWLMAHPEKHLTPTETNDFSALCARRLEGIPVAYLLGTWGFYGLTLQVTPAVLIPRPETELVVDWGLELRADFLPGGESVQIIDLGTGSGAIALAVKSRWAQAEVTGIDASQAALEVATRNAATLGLDIHFRHGDWWSAVRGQRFGLALANPPYIASGDRHLRALEHEPESALTPGGDGLDAIRDIVAGAPEHLLPGSWLLLEHGWDQADAVQALLSDYRFDKITTRQDLGGQERCTGARWGTAPQSTH
jgi:release factor glutamine methyltransferase